MNKYILLIFLMGTFQSVFSQETDSNAFFKASKFESDFYLQFEGEVGQILQNSGMFAGGSANWLVNNRYVLGAQYKQLTSKEDISKKLSTSDNVYPRYRWAGLKFGYVFFSGRKLNLEPNLSLNWADLLYELPEGSVQRWNFFNAELSVNGIFNASKYFSLGIGLTYRLNAGINLPNLKNSDFNSVGGKLFIRFGTVN